MNTPDIKKFCSLGSDSEQLLKDAVVRMGLSTRAYMRVLKLARTIADLSEREHIQVEDVAEAIQYRLLDREAQ